ASATGPASDTAPESGGAPLPEPPASDEGPADRGEPPQPIARISATVTARMRAICERRRRQTVVALPFCTKCDVSRHSRATSALLADDPSATGPVALFSRLRLRQLLLQVVDALL